MEVISLPLWLPLYCYMISNKRFVSTVEDSKISNDISGVIKQSTRLEGNIKGSNTNQNLRVNNLLVFKFDNAANSDSTENNLKLYEVTENETNCYLYKFKQSAKCVEVKYNKRLVWSIKEGAIRYPREISCNPSENNVVIYFSDDFKLDYSHYDIKKNPTEDVTQKSVTDESKPVDATAPTETPTPEPRSDERHSELSEAPESKDDHMTESYQTSDDSKPVDSSPVTHTPTPKPTSEQKPTETPEETKDSTDPVSQQSESLEHDSSRVADAPTDEPSSEQEPTETSEETRDVADRVSQQSESLEHDSTAVTEAPTTQPSSEEGHSEISEETKDSADRVSQQSESLEHDSSRVADAPTDEPSSEQEPTETSEETKDSADPVSQQSESLEHDSTAVTEAPTTQNAATPKSQELNKPGSPEVKLIDLDINNSKSTTEFDCYQEGRVVTYTAKEGYGFSAVKKGKGSCTCTRSDEIIWEAKDKTQASNKVIASQVVETIQSSLFCIDIHIMDGSKLGYLKSSVPPYNKEWIQKSENVPKERHEPQIKIYTKDETKDEPVENDTSKYTVDIFFNEKKTFQYIYHIKKEVKCTQVKYNDNEIWNNTEDINHETIDIINFDTGDRTIVLKHKGTVVKEYKIPDEAKQK